ncbi:MAG: prepilin peptidase [Planctomycetales bacterium]
MTNWHVKFVAIVLIVAAYIDGKELRVPNWLTYSMVFSGLIFNALTGGWSGLGWALVGMVVGLATLMPLYSVGGMGAGDVKLMAGIGAWLGPLVTFYAFLATAVVGGLMAVVMVQRRQAFFKHFGNFLLILDEFKTVKNPVELSKIAAVRKPTMLLLPYGIPICIGSIGFFLYHYKMY